MALLTPDFFIHMYVIAWEFIIRAESAAQFEAAYGPEGEWVRLFFKAGGYRETQLLRDMTDPLRYVTLDYWQSREAYDQFRKTHVEEYKALDERCEQLTVRETKLGEFENP